ncbi:MAG TPA: helicase-related protein [Verrucomicrobiae bacterium]|nr:helicase-related protein [Verrucomicrobiae bacterium]
MLESGRRERLQLLKAYAPFVAACAAAHVSPFSGDDAQKLREAVRSFKGVYASDINDFIEDLPAPPLAFRTQLYRQACGGLYSMRFICAGWLTPLPRVIKQLAEKFPEEKRQAVEEMALTWVQWLAWDTAIDKDFERRRRAEIAGFDKPTWAHKGTYRKEIAKVISDKGFDPSAIEGMLQESFAFFDSGEGGYYLKPETLVLNIALEHKWFRCQSCFTDSPHLLLGHCPRCGGHEITEFDPNVDPYVQSRKGFWRKPVKAAHDGKTTPRLLSAEEHTAQLSHKEATSGWVKTEEYELRFQDVLADPVNKPAVDVLSCTTTMEVGIDIGSLVAVGLRNVPPQRENYQQRAGRAGRRGSAVSTVVTYCQGGAHDNHYYAHVDEISSGAPRKLTVKVNNAKIARRHVRSFLLQEYFGEREAASSPDILSSLGTLQGFFEGTGEGTLADFCEWMKQKVAAGIGKKVQAWLGNNLEDVKDVAEWATTEAKDFAAKLSGLKPKAQEMIAREAGMNDAERTKLLEFLLSEAILPTYAFPTDLSTFRVEEWDTDVSNLVARYAPQQAISRALSEYAPGRLITIDKRTYKSAAVTANVSLTEPKRARPLFTNPHRKPYVFCDQKHCCYVEDVGDQNGATRENADCPLCGIGKLRVVEMITPEVFLPDDGREVSALDDDSDYSYATPAQFPVPLHQSGDKQQLVRKLSDRLEVFRRADAQLVVVNKGDPDDQSGFHVCDACGRATLAKVGAPPTSHRTPYKVLASNRSHARAVARCEGEIKGPVFLGNRFVTDLVILRIQITKPLCQSPRAMAAEYCALQDALQTLADALPLAAGRMFDVDFTEFSAGYRLINQSGEGASIAAEIYMFDTLSGGAGYSERVGDAMEELLKDYVRKVLSCDDEHGEGCDRSCYRCLRHYYNQFYHSRLDRHLALDLLDLILDGKSPADGPVAEQEQQLQGLQVMLDLDGITTQMGGSVDGIKVPLLAKHKGKSVAVCVTHALVAEQFRSGLVDDLDGSSVPLRPLNAYQLTRNLPSCHLAIRKCLGLRPS